MQESHLYPADDSQPYLESHDAVKKYVVDWQADHPTAVVSNVRVDFVPGKGHKVNFDFEED